MWGLAVTVFVFGCFWNLTVSGMKISQEKEQFLPELVPEQNIHASDYDVTFLITDTTHSLYGDLASLKAGVEHQKSHDPTFGDGPSVALLDSGSPNTERVATNHTEQTVLVYMEVGQMDRDILDDVRRFEDAGRKGMEKVKAMGKESPLLILPRTASDEYPTDLLVTLLGIFQALYLPIEAREAGTRPTVTKLGVWGAGAETLKRTLSLAATLEKARIVSRDICTGDPERMAPPRVAEYVQAVFQSTPRVSVRVVQEQANFQRDYPILAAVNRAASTVERHRGRLLFLEYDGQGSHNRTLFILGKGITFDSGGANLKIGSKMESMLRDKCGAAVVAGFFKVLSILQPPNLRVVGAMPMVRNSIGENSYVVDEVLTARSGVTVRVGNTDAEGRMIMADVLCDLREQAENSVNPHIVSIATLTYSAMSMAGQGYAIALDNGPARGTAEQLSAVGDEFGEPLEVSRLRREDFAAHVRGTDIAELINAGKTVSALRAHQGPMAFLMQVSGLHPARRDTTAVPYTHIDIAGPAMVWPHMPQAEPLVALTAHFLLSEGDRAALNRGNRSVSMVEVEMEEKEELKEEAEEEEEYGGFLPWWIYK